MHTPTRFLTDSLAGRIANTIERFPDKVLLRKILRSRGSFVALVTQFLPWCHEEKEQRDLEPAHRVKQVQIAGGPIHEGHLRQAMALFPDAEIHRGYGLTEAIRVAQISSADPAFLHDTDLHLLPGQQVEIRDAAGKPLPRGTNGRIWVRGPNVMLGYDDAGDGVYGGFLDTGDMGSLSPENRLTLCGREGSLFKIRGESVSGREIEAAAVASVPYLRDARCLPVTSAGRSRPVLFVELEPGAGELLRAKPLPDIRSALLGRLRSKLKMPDSICFVERFPRTHNGKVCLKTLKDWFAAGATELIGRQREIRVARCQGLHQQPYAAEGEHALDTD